MSAIRTVGFAAICGLLCAAPAAQETIGELADAAMARDMARVRTLVREGADPNEPGLYGTPALLWTVRVEDIPTSKLLLDAGADPDARTPEGITALHMAAENGDLESVRMLLTAGADPDARDGASETALMIAARQDHRRIAELLLGTGASVDLREPAFGQSALHIAARHGSAAVAQLLITAGADIDAATRTAPPPALRLPEDNRGSKGIGIVRGGWPAHGMRYPTPGGKTPLLYATRSGDTETTRLLLDGGARLEQVDADGITPLLNAIINVGTAADGSTGAHFETAALLLERGADVNASDWFGQTPLWAAVDVRNLDVARPGSDNGIDRAAALQLIRVLLEAGAKPNAQTREYPPERRFLTRLGSLSWVDFTGQTAFVRAALAGDTTVMQLLLDHGADPAITTYEGTSALMADASGNWVVNQTYDEGENGLLAAVRLAHLAGNSPTAVNSMGLSAVHGAANRGSDEIIRYLAEAGAPLDTPDNEGRTPLDWAAGVFLATHPPVRKPATIALLNELLADRDIHPSSD